MYLEAASHNQKLLACLLLGWRSENARVVIVKSPQEFPEMAKMFRITETWQWAVVAVLASLFAWGILASRSGKIESDSEIIRDHMKKLGYSVIGIDQRWPSWPLSPWGLPNSLNYTYYVTVKSDARGILNAWVHLEGEVEVRWVQADPLAE